MYYKKRFKGFNNYGDVNYMTYGGVFVQQTSDTEYFIVELLNLSEYGYTIDQYVINYGYIDITDSWINKQAVKSYTGNVELQAIDILYYYGVYHCAFSEIRFNSEVKCYKHLKFMLKNYSNEVYIP